MPSSSMTSSAEVSPAQESKAGTGDGDHLAALRAELDRRNLQGFVVPRADEHQGEYVPARAERLAWLTGFTGSAGSAAVLPDKAAVFVDGRYTVQVREQIDLTQFAPRHVTEEPLSDWLKENLTDGQRVGFDPWLHTDSQVLQLRNAVSAAKGELVACETNPLDSAWQDQPEAPLAEIVPHQIDFAGQASFEKRAEIAAKIKQAGCAAAVSTLPDSIAWLLNVRGGDVPCTPLPLSFLILANDGVATWFVDDRKLSDGLREELGNGVDLRAPAELADALEELGRRKSSVMADPASAPKWVFERLEGAGAEIVKASDPCQLPKAQKNTIELQGTRNAHLRDGAALTRFLSWLDREAPAQVAAGNLSELDLVEKLLSFRKGDSLFRDSSFETISASGPNGALCHYRVTPDNDRRLGTGELYLVDSGAQYLDGTTDVTRTVAIGEPSAEMRDRYTRVLKGHIALALARFPKGTNGGQLDSLARYPLWQAGLDYDHGTGHGVGSYLSVHEGPQRIAKAGSNVALLPGMILSNEPGYYKAGGYGIRIENLVAVIEQEQQPGEDRAMLAFETLTLAPIDTTLVEPALLTDGEVAWLDSYHARVRASLIENLEGDDATWLEKVTQPLAR
ncbi:aminopeptidase P family protein [Pelagibius sp. Alg239-R121]|uniref:aminopeptidase P family protein n=1 Tax=Pelagibius sp. Alg239-R121 TaxID=2993448 RepID=UPI0024A68B7F|nr:aminopeptidase P family protein [Pelagibius sp. Alg239-R121]